jgi:hypothetical protein
MDQLRFEGGAGAVCRGGDRAAGAGRGGLTVRLALSSRGKPPPPVGKRKREGVVYTPDMVTRFLVEKTIGLSLRERFDAGAFLNNKCFFLPISSPDLCALVQSLVLWRFLQSNARVKRGGYIEAEAQYVSQLPIPKMPAPARKKLAALGEVCTKAARERYEIQSAVRRRILDLAPPERAKLTGKLEDWHELDFAAFRAAVKTAFRAEIPLKERAEWENYLSENRASVRALTSEIDAAEREIDKIVYALFELTDEEVALLEASLEGQY